MTDEEAKCAGLPASNDSNAEGSSTASTARRRSDRMVWLLLGGLVLIAALVLGAWAIAADKMPDYVGKPLSGDIKAEVIEQNSPLTDYVFLTPNAEFPRTDQISKITIHHMAGDLSLESVGALFSRRDMQSSANYAIDSDGNVALYVEEANRAWSSKNRANDEQAITIEVANDEMYGDWHVSDAAFEKLVELCADICERNGIEKLEFTGDADGSLNYHGMLSDTECPGPYLKSRMQDLADEVNARIGASKN